MPELLLVLLAAAVLSGRSRPPLPPQPDSGNVGGVSVGMTYSDVLRVLGLPIQIGEESSMVSDRVSYAKMRWKEDAPVKMAYFQEGRMVFCLGSSSSLFCGKEPIGVSQLGPGKQSSWVTRTWWPAQNIGLTHDDEIVQVAPRYGQPTLGNDASWSTPWGDDYNEWNVVDGMELGTRTVARKPGTVLHYNRSGYIRAVQGKEFTHRGFLGHHNLSLGTIQVGDPIREGFVHVKPGVTLTTQDGKVSAIKMEIQDQALLQALDQEADFMGH